NQIIGGLTKNDAGGLLLAGDGSNLQGPITLNGGLTQLLYASSTANKLGSGALTLAGGELDLSANATTAVSQTVQGGTAVNAGQSLINVLINGGAGLTFNLNGISRTAAGTLDAF